MKNKTFFKWIGRFLIILSFFYIGKSIWSSRENFTGSLNGVVFLLVVCSGCINAGGIILYAFLYRRLISNIADMEIESNLIVLPYVEANLYKYLPGNVMHYVGRNKIAADGTVTYEQVNVASFIEIIINLLSSVCLGSVFSGPYLLASTFAYIRIEGIIAIGAIGAVATLILLVIFHKQIAAARKRLFKRRILVTVFTIWVIYMLCSILGHLIFILLLRAIGGTIPAESVLPVIGVSQLAWLIGFITPGVPGGIGIREAMLQVLLSELSPAWMITMTGILTRISQIAGEIIAFLTVWFMYKGKHSLQGGGK